MFSSSIQANMPKLCALKPRTHLWCSLGIWNLHVDTVVLIPNTSISHWWSPFGVHCVTPNPEDQTSLFLSLDFFFIFLSPFLDSGWIFSPLGIQNLALGARLRSRNVSQILCYLPIVNFHRSILASCPLFMCALNPSLWPCGHALSHRGTLFFSAFTLLFFLISESFFYYLWSIFLSLITRTHTLFDTHTHTPTHMSTPSLTLFPSLSCSRLSLSYPPSSFSYTHIHIHAYTHTYPLSLFLSLTSLLSSHLLFLSLFLYLSLNTHIISLPLSNIRHTHTLSLSNYFSHILFLSLHTHTHSLALSKIRHTHTLSLSI